MKFREANEGDLDILVGMMRELYEHDGVTFDEDRSRRVSLELLGLPDQGRIWLIELEGEPAGYYVLTYGFSLEYQGRHGFIDELFVRREFRGQGLGGLAVEHASAVCRTLGMKVILLEVAHSNERAHRLYERIGFHEHGRRLMSRMI